MNRESQLAAIVAEMEALLAKPTLSDTEVTRLQGLADEGETLKRQIEQETALRMRAREFAVNKTNLHSRVTAAAVAETTTFEETGEFVQLSKDRQLAKAVTGTLSSKQLDAISRPDYCDQFEAFVRGGAVGRFAMNETNLDDGGVLVPAVILNEVFGRTAAPTNVLGNVNRIMVSSSEVNIPRFTGGSAVASSGLTVSWLGESGSVSADTSLENLSDVMIPVHRGAMEIAIQRGLLEDSAFDVIGWMTRLVGDAYRLTIEDKILNGDGVAKPRGIISNYGSGTNQVAGVNIGTTPTFDNILSLVADLPDAHDANAMFVMRRATYIGKIVALRDSGGPVLADPTVGSGMAATNLTQSSYLGYPVIKSGYMPAYASAAKSILFGDLRETYTLVENVALSIDPLVDPAYTRADKVGFYIRFRVGGDVVGNWASRIGVQS